MFFKHLYFVIANITCFFIYFLKVYKVNHCLVRVRSFRFIPRINIDLKRRGSDLISDK